MKTITYKQWDAATKRVEKQNLQNNGKSLTASTISMHYNKMVYEVFPHEKTLLVHDKWRKKIKSFLISKNSSVFLHS